MKRIEKKQRKFMLFDLNRDGKGVYEKESRKPNLKFFFVLLFRKFTQLLQLNLLMLGQVIPIIGIILINIFGAKTYNISNALYAPLYGITKIVNSPSLQNELNMVGQQMEAPLVTPIMLFGFVALGLFLFITFGWQNVGAAYVLRGLYRGDPVFVFSDFFHAIKKNFKQGLIVGMIDVVCCAALVIDLMYFLNVNAIIFGIIVAITIIYIFMRFYIYQLLITFDIKILKLIKNALIFSVLGIFRNLVALVGIIILIVIHLLLIWWLLPIGISIPLVIPFFYIVSVIGFISVFAAYPVIEKYMITPYSQENVVDAEDDTESNDDGQIIEDNASSDI